MQIALIADLHGNRPAVEALEQDLKMMKPDKIYCLGDIVGKGPSSDYTFDWAMNNCDLILGGNWDYGVGHQQFPFDRFYWDQLGEERLKTLRELPLEHHLTMNGRKIRLFHGRPVMETLVTVRYPVEQIAPFFEDDRGNRFDAVIYADAHSQQMRTIAPGLFVNVGSVGNGIGIPKCCYAILNGDPDAHGGTLEIRMRQLDYDREQAVKDALAAPDVPRIDAYINEIRTGVYSRK